MSRRKRRFLILALLAVAYVGSYIWLSSQGRYVPLICGASDGSENWYPLHCDNTSPGSFGRIKTDVPSPLGLFYAPLLMIDQAIFHPPIPGPEPWPPDRMDLNRLQE